MRTLALAGLGLLGCAAGQGPVRIVRVTSPMAQTVSLLGDTLYTLSRSGEGGPARALRMADAREAVARDSGSLDNRLRLVRATAEMGYLRDAVEQCTQLTTFWYSDPRVFRERGELLFRLRQFDGALADFRHAGLLLIGRSMQLEVDAIGDTVGNRPLSTTQFQVLFLQGLTLYGKGSFQAAAPVLLEAVRQAGTTEDRTRALLWLFFSVRRFAGGAEAARVLDLVQPEWSAITDAPELLLLLAFKGIIPTDTIRARALGSNGDGAGLLSYGVAYALLLDPERKTDAELWLQRAHRGDWDALPHVIAEAELARLQAARTVIR